MRQVATGKFPPQAEVPPRSHEGKDQGGCRRAATAHASVNSGARDVAEAGHYGLLCIPCSTNKLGCVGCVPRRDHQALAVDTTAPQPEGLSHLGNRTRDPGATTRRVLQSDTAFRGASISRRQYVSWRQMLFYAAG